MDACCPDFDTSWREAHGQLYFVAAFTADKEPAVPSRPMAGLDDMKQLTFLAVLRLELCSLERWPSP